MRRYWPFYLITSSLLFGVIDWAVPDVEAEFLELETSAAGWGGAVVAIVARLVTRRWRFAFLGLTCGMMWGDVAATSAPLLDKLWVVLLGTPIVALIVYFLVGGIVEELTKKAWKMRSQDQERDQAATRPKVVQLSPSTSSAVFEPFAAEAEPGRDGQPPERKDGRKRQKDDLSPRPQG